MNILLINHYAGSPRHGMEFRPYHLARVWIKLGHNVRIVASSESHLHQITPFIEGSTALESVEGIEYLWVKTPTYRGNGLGRVINMFSFAMKLFVERKQVINNYVPDVVIASSPHPFIFRGAKNIAKKTGAKLIYEVRDLWPQSLIELLGMSTSHPLIVLMQHEENYAYKHANKVASLLPKALDHMFKHGLKADKFIYTPNGIAVDDWDDFSPMPDEQLNKIEQFKKQFGFLIGYAGTHGIPNALSFLISAAELIKEQDIGIVLIGDGPQKESLALQAKEMELKNILFLDSVDKTKIPSFLAQMDALYIGWEHQSLYRFGISANKLFEYMMSGKPIIHSVKTGNDPITESGCGVSCPPEDTDLIAECILQISKLSKKKLVALGLNGKKYVINNHDYTVLAKNYLNSL